MISDEVASEFRPSCKETIVNSFAVGRFGGELGGSMKECCQGKERGLVIGVVGLVQSQLRLERKLLDGR